MSAFVELIKKIGIFMIAAQAVIHFAPAQKYEKYIRMIVGVMILLQLLAPVYQILTKSAWEELDWNILTESGPEESIPELDSASNSVMNGVVKQMEEEIKSRLNREIEAENYHVVSVDVSMQTYQNADEYEGKQYEVDSVRVVVRRTYTAADKGIQSGANETDMPDAVEKVRIQKIEVALDNQNGQSETDEDEAGGGTEDTGFDERQKKEKEFKQRFCSVLGMEEKYMEVNVYGIVDEGGE